jgi:hypothetical protein
MKRCAKIFIIETFSASSCGMNADLFLAKLLYWELLGKELFLMKPK